MIGKVDITVELANEYNDIFTQGHSGTGALCMHFATVYYLYKLHLYHLSLIKNIVIKIHNLNSSACNTGKKLKMLF